MKTYLFDFDGTLVDSMPSFISGVLKILDQNGRKYGDDIIKILTPLGIVGTADYLIKEFNLDYTREKLIEIIKNNLYEDYLLRIPAKKNVIEVLRQLKTRGASLNILTASPHVTLDACLKRLNMFELFDNVWSCDDFLTSKTDPNIYKRVAKTLDKPVNEILFLDDNFFADQTAKSAKMKVCGVFDESSSESVEQIKSITDFYIYDFIELLDIDF